MARISGLNACTEAPLSPCGRGVGGEGFGKRRNFQPGPPHREPRFDEILPFLGKIEHRQAGCRRNAFDGFAHAGGRFGRQHEPHIEGMVTPVVVRDFRKAVDDGRDPVEIRFRHSQRRQGKGAAQPFDLIQRPETGERAIRQQLPQGLQHGILARLQPLGHYRERPLAQRKTALPLVDQATFQLVHAATSLPLTRPISSLSEKGASGDGIAKGR
ncbi:MAG: hypothetical protein IPK53_10620 [bacterium]|nr:hypothetical protein [bacterium]